MNARTTCPFLKEVVMLYCDACRSHKLLPRDQVVSMGPCSSSYDSCPLFREIAGGVARPIALSPETRKEVKP